MVASRSSSAPVSTMTVLDLARPARRSRSGRRPGRAPRAGPAWRPPTARASSGVGLPSRRSSPTGLPVIDGVAERTHHVVAHLERVAERQPVGAERREQLVGPVGRGQHGAEVQRALDGVLAALVAADALGLVAPPLVAHPAEDVEHLTDVELDAQLVPDRPRRPALMPTSSWSAYTNARSPTRIATPSPKRRDSPAQPAAACCSAKTVWVVGSPRRLAASSITSSWNSAKACISSNAAPAFDHHRVVGIATGADEPPVAKAGRSRLPPESTRRPISANGSARSTSKLHHRASSASSKTRRRSSTREAMLCQRCGRRGGGGHGGRVGTSATACLAELTNRPMSPVCR